MKKTFLTLLISSNFFFFLAFQLMAQGIDNIRLDGEYYGIDGTGQRCSVKISKDFMKTYYEVESNMYRDHSPIENEILENGEFNWEEGAIIEWADELGERVLTFRPIMLVDGSWRAYPKSYALKGSLLGKVFVCQGLSFF